MPNTVKKWIISGVVETLSPLVIGTGNRDSDTDIIIQKNEKGDPFIPATSFAGSLKHFFFEELDLEGFEAEYEQLWGTSKNIRDNNNQVIKHISIKSKIFFSDLKLTDNSKAVVELRDGIRIDNKTGLVEETGKYDYEMLAKGATFNLKIEISQEENVAEEIVPQFIVSLKEHLKAGNIAVGSKNTSGFGKLQLKEFDIFEYNFKEKKDVIAWLKSEEKATFDVPKNYESFKLKNNQKLDINLQLKLKTALLIRSYSAEPIEPDSAFITSNGQAVIPGTSAKGALSARAKKILRTFLPEEQSEILEKNLFGYVNSKNEDEKIKSRFSVRETYKSLNDVARKIQARIKIDRFTGGTIKTALFDEMPLWPSESDEFYEIKYGIRNFEDWEVGLALLVMKDLMTSDLAIGGGKSIGRGMFTGEKTTITINGEDREIKQLENNRISVKPEDREFLERYVKCFNRKMRELKEGETA